jgi:hypothetical protein
MTTNEANELPMSLPRWLRLVPVERVIRIDVGLEGKWSETVRPVWSQTAGFLGFEQVPYSHSEYRPALELYLDEGWIGLPCFKIHGGRNVLDEARARQVVDYVESCQSG